MRVETRWTDAIDREFVVTATVRWGAPSYDRLEQDDPDELDDVVLRRGCVVGSPEAWRLSESDIRRVEDALWDAAVAAR